MRVLPPVPPVVFSPPRYLPAAPSRHQTKAWPPETHQQFQASHPKIGNKLQNTGAKAGRW